MQKIVKKNEEVFALGPRKWKLHPSEKKNFWKRQIQIFNEKKFSFIDVQNWVQQLFEIHKNVRFEILGLKKLIFLKNSQNTQTWPLCGTHSSKFAYFVVKHYPHETFHYAPSIDQICHFE